MKTYDPEEPSPTLNAVSFYERAGYVEERPTVHRLPSGMELQCVRMSKQLASRPCVMYLPFE